MTDVIENPAARDLTRVKDNAKFDFVATPSTRLIFLQPDIGRNPSPFVKAADGKNPLQDVRVRRAMNMAIDRKAIVQRIMDGMAARLPVHARRHVRRCPRPRDGSSMTPKAPRSCWPKPAPQRL